MPTSKNESSSRRYGEGSIYQRKDGYWAAKYFPRAGAKAKYLYGKSEGEVKRKLRELKQSPEVLIQTDPIRMTVEEYFTNWINVYKRPTVKQATFDRMDVVLRKQIKPHIGNLQMGAVTSDDCQNLITTLTEEGLSFTVVKKAFDMMNSCFLHATIKKDIPENPMLVVQGPSASMFESKDIRALTEEEEKKLLEELKRNWSTGNSMYSYRDVFIVMLNTGVREGEMVALDWEDIDFEDKLMNVHKTVVMIKGRDKTGQLTGKCWQAVQDTPKTKSGNRMVPLNEKALTALKRLRKAYPDSKHVVTSETGSRPVVNVLQKQLKRAASRCDMVNVTPHTLRHTFATRLFERGADVKTVSAILGHSSVNITYNTYIHVIKEKKMDVVSLLD